MAPAGSKTHVALFASPGIGHLIPVLELGERFVSHFNFDVTVFVVVTDASTAESLLRQQSSYKNIVNVVLLPPVDITCLVNKPMAILSQLVLLVRLSLPDLRSAIASMKTPPSALIVDIFGTEAFAIADEFNMLKYTFFTTNAWFLALTLYAPYVDRERENDHVLHHVPLEIPGCTSVTYEDTIDVYMDQKDRSLHDDYVKIGLEIAKADGILTNTWEELEPTTLQALRDPKALSRLVQARIFPVGPLVRRVRSLGSAEPKSDVLKWLDHQPAGSVLYVSFGSGGTLPADQLTELAWGLEQSQQRFIWVVRPPVKNSACGSFFEVARRSADGTPDYLPEGFVARTQKLGLVIPKWAPQREILAHPSTGGFLSHCGWNSTLESIVNGIPIIAWPLYAEQTMNATVLSDQLGVAVRSRVVAPDGVLRREEIEKMVRTVMSNEDAKGKAMKERVEDLKRRSLVAITEVGSSHSALSQVANECEIGLRGLRERGRGA